MINMSLRIFLLVILSIAIQARAIDDNNATRLIIGFHSESYHGLGGATEAYEYINKHYKNDQSISFVRPLGSSAILVQINPPGSSQLEETINQLLLLKKIRYVEIDSTMLPLQNRSMETIPLR